MEKLFYLICFIAAFISCTNENSSRYISEAIPCNSDNSCFQKVDSLLLSQGDNLLTVMQWQNLSYADTVISFHDYSDAGVNATILVLDYIQSIEGGEYLIRMGSDDGFRIFVNGEEIARRIIGRALKPDSDWIKVELEKGTNQILFQVNQQDGSWGLYYQIHPEFDLGNLFDRKAFEIYRDLPEATIINDTSQFIQLKKDPRHKLDSFHSMHFSWIDPYKNRVISTLELSAMDYPDALPLPEESIFPLLLSYQLKNENQEIVYKEIIPVFDEASAQKWTKKTWQQLSDSDEETIWRNGLEILFASQLGVKSGNTYSTRMKSEFLWDVLNRTGVIQYALGGPRTFIFNGALARSYVPYNLPHKIPNVLGLHVEFSDSMRYYLESHPGSSHALMTRWNSYSQKYGAKLTFPFIAERSTDKNTYEVLASFSEQYSDSFHVIAWSKSVASFLNTIESRPFPVKEAAFISPWLIDAPTERFLITSNIHTYNPQINFHIWHGQDDTNVPEYIIKNWIHSFREQNLKVDYYTVPHSTHWNYWQEPEEEFYPALIQF